MKEKGITVVSPMWGDITITNRMVFSVINQFISKKNPFNIHLVLVDDYIEGRNKDGTSHYEYYLSDEFKKKYDTEHIKITLIKNEEHKYQGESREIGWNVGDYKFFLMIDCDDMLAPNACDRYLNIIETATTPTEENKKPNPIACIHGLVYSFDTNNYEDVIIGESIWVQGRCYNRDFLNKYEVHFPKGGNSNKSEDYPFIRKLDYALAHDENWQVLKVPYRTDVDCQATAFWFPNENSLSRKDPHYTQHLAGWTMQSSNAVMDYFEWFNKEYGFEDMEDETMKQETLNMTIYSFYNLLDFVREVAMTDYKPIKEDWDVLRDNVARLRQRLKDKYWDELVYSDIDDMLYNVKHNTDVHFVESWIGNFYDFMNKDVNMLSMSYDEMMEYAKTLEFDSLKHEQHAPYVLAWNKRHNG